MFERVGKDLVWRFRIGPITLALNPATLGTALGISLLLVLLALWLRRAIPKDPEAPPPRRLVLLVFLVDFMENQVLGGASEKLRRSLLPLIATLFLFILACNLSSILPIPGMVAPTQDLNVTLGLALLVYSLTHVYGMRTKGVFRHLKGYLEPIPVMLPMNLIGDMGRTISHGFRLFGNILGGAIMATVSLPVMVELLLRFLGPILALPAIPIVGIGLTFVLNGFFGIFAGTIQALVFTLLAAAYIQAATE